MPAYPEFPVIQGAFCRAAPEIKSGHSGPADKADVQADERVP